MKKNLYREAPTFLHKKGKEPTLFKTQEEVDKAWGEGWFGPPWLKKHNPLLSSIEFVDKQTLLDAVALDDRYKGIKVNKGMNVSTLERKLLKWEEENDIVEDDYGTDG